VTRFPDLTAASGAPAAPLDTAAILAAVHEAAYAWRIDTDVLTWTANAAAVLGIADPAAIATGRGFAQFLAPDNAETRFDAVMRSGRVDDGSGVPYQVQYCLQPDPGSETRLWLEDTGRWFADAGRRPFLAQGVIRVINERREHEQRLAFLSRFDALTGELNRSHLTDLLSVALEDSIRFQNSCGLALLAIDGVGRINEAYGYDVADEVIAAVAARIRAKMRAGDLLGRYSGNKFALVLKNCTPDDLSNAADRLLAAVREEVVPTSAGPIAVTVTMGGVTAPRHARNTTEMLARAQESLDAARARRPGSFVSYRPSVERDAMRRANVQAADEIVSALNERRIFAVYEPIAHAATGKPAFHEALMRVRRADGAIMPAADVIPVAERLGLVRLIDHRMLDLAAAALVEDPCAIVSLNVSSNTTADADWWSRFAGHMRAAPDIASRLIIEITESAAIQDLDETRGFCSRVKALGCRIAIDDFGAGYTSFRNLRKLGVDVIKIDGAFVQNMLRSEEDAVFVRTLLDLGRGLGIATVAEWVPDAATASALAQWGCNYLQGAYVGPAEDRPRTAGGCSAVPASA